MKNITLKTLISLFIFSILLSYNSLAQFPWKQNQLIPPVEMNKILNSKNASKYHIFSIGYQAVVKNSVDIGATNEKQNLEKLKKQVGKLPKDANVVIYCGCCPYSRCPNVRPAFNALIEMGYKNTKLLDLPQNIKVDWIDKGYAIKK